MDCFYELSLTFFSVKKIYQFTNTKLTIGNPKLFLDNP